MSVALAGTDLIMYDGSMYLFISRRRRKEKVSEFMTRIEAMRSVPNLLECCEEALLIEILRNNLLHIFSNLWQLLIPTCIGFGRCTK